MNKKFETINWNRIANRVDYSAWSRMNDFIWEPERVPVKKDKKDFDSLDKSIQETILKAFGSLAFLSTLQVEYGDDLVKRDSVTKQEYSVWSALGYQEATANKGYSNVIQNLARPTQINNYFDWADSQDELQELANLLVDIYQNGKPFEKKIALSFTEMCLYHIGFYAPLYAFGAGKLVHTAEVVKYAIRTTTFNAMYPGVKFRLESAETSQEDQDSIKQWTMDFVNKIVPLGKKLIQKIYEDTGWADEATKYFYYTLNKNFMNLGYPMPYKEQIEMLSDRIQQGVIKSADSEDFFFYSNRNALTKFVNKNN